MGLGHGVGDVDELASVALGMIAEEFECVAFDAVDGHEDAFGSFDGRAPGSQLAELAGEAWATGHRETAWESMVRPEIHPGVAVRVIADGPVYRTIFAATRAADANRPSVQALMAAVRATATQLGSAAPAEVGR